MEFLGIAIDLNLLAIMRLILILEFSRFKVHRPSQKMYLFAYPINIYSKV